VNAPKRRRRFLLELTNSQGRGSATPKEINGRKRGLVLKPADPAPPK
jgi:hypothetical protein